MENPGLHLLSGALFGFIGFISNARGLPNIRKLLLLFGGMISGVIISSLALLALSQAKMIMIEENGCLSAGVESFVFVF